MNLDPQPKNVYKVVLDKMTSQIDQWVVHPTERYYINSETFYVWGETFEECIKQIKERLDFSFHISNGDKYEVFDQSKVGGCREWYIIREDFEGWIDHEGGG